MSIHSRKLKSGATRYRSAFRHPYSGLMVYGPWETKAEATRRDDELKFRLKHDRESFVEAPAAAPAGMTVAQLIQLYLATVEMTESSMRFSVIHCKPLMLLLGLKSVADLTRADLETFVESQRAAGVKQNTIQRRISILKAALNWAHETGRIEEHALARYRCRRGEDQKFIPPTPEEAAAIYRNAPEHVRRAVLLGFQLGVRVGPSELFKLRWEHFELDRGVATIPAAQKNRSEPFRRVHLRASLVAMLKAWQAEDACRGVPWLIHYRGLPVGSIKTAWAHALEAAGIPRRIRPYDLRHAFATYTLEGGADPGTVAQIMGHSTTAMVHRHYQHVLDVQKVRAAEAAPELDI